MKILIVFPNWIGDIVMCLPAVEKIREFFPENEIYALIRKDFFPLIEENLKILKIKPLYYKDKNLKTTYDLIKKLRKLKFKKGFIFPRSFRMLCLSVLSGINEIYGYGNDILKKIFFKVNVKRDNDILSKHRVFYYLELPKRIKNFDSFNPPTLIIPLKYKKWAEDLLKYLHINDKMLIGINPGATYGEAKCWDKDYFIELIEMIKNEIKCPIFLIGGKDNFEKCEYIRKKTKVLNFAGKLSIIESAALIEKMNVFITNDTGPMHIADALGVKVLAIFGPTDVNETPPFRKNGQIIYKSLDCSPCKKRTCPLEHNNCMKLIKPVEVYNALKELISC